MSTANWIKLRVNIWEKPEVQYIADNCEIPVEYAVGMLCKVWTWFDQHTSEGITNKFGAKVLEKYTKINVTESCDTIVTLVTGSEIIVTPFLESMMEVDWITLTDDGLWSLIDWSEHNGETAKGRAEATKRQVKSRGNKKKKQLEEEQKLSVTESCDNSVTREEKRREEKIREKNKNTLSNPTDKTIKKITNANDDLDFIAFYERYDHKKGKDQAFKAWNRLNKADKIEAFEKVEHYFSTIKEGISKAHPSTYLNNKRWTDEVSHDTIKPKLSAGVNNLKDILQDTQMQNLEIYNEPQTLALGGNHEYR